MRCERDFHECPCRPTFGLHAPPRLGCNLQSPRPCHSSSLAPLCKHGGCLIAGQRPLQGRPSHLGGRGPAAASRCRKKRHDRHVHLNDTRASSARWSASDVSAARMCGTPFIAQCNGSTDLSSNMYLLALVSGTPLACAGRVWMYRKAAQADHHTFKCMTSPQIRCWT